MDHREAGGGTHIEIRKCIDHCNPFAADLSTEYTDSADLMWHSGTQIYELETRYLEQSNLRGNAVRGAQPCSFPAFE
jgi:hypothetical protein